MRPRLPLFAFLVCLTATAPAMADPMELDFSWRGTNGCVTLFPNPEIRLRNVPPETKLLLLTLSQGARELGGQQIPVPVNGVVPSGSIRTFGPCRPDVYQWAAVARSATGGVLAEARRARFYPTDEPAGENR